MVCGARACPTNWAYSKSEDRPLLIAQPTDDSLVLHPIMPKRAGTTSSRSSLISLSLGFVAESDPETRMCDLRELTKEAQQLRK